jgi:hypothetical protein
MAFVGLADAFISVSLNPGGPDRTKIAPIGVALFPGSGRYWDCHSDLRVS